MIIRIVKMKFKPEFCGTFEEIFESNKEKIRNQSGCQHLELLVDVDDPTVYHTYSIWDSTEHLDRYRHSKLFADTWADTKVLFDAKPTAHSLQKMAILP